MTKEYSNPIRKPMFADDNAIPVPPPKEFGRQVYDNPIGPPKKKIFFKKGNPFKVSRKIVEDRKKKKKKD
jgi:hypothetical protein